MPFAGFRPRSRRSNTLEHDVVNGGSYLMCANDWAELADSGPETRKGDHLKALPERLPVGIAAMLDQPKDGPRREVGVDGVGQDHRHAHRRRNDQVRVLGVASLDQVSRAYEEFSVMTLADHALDALLNVRTESLPIQCIDAAIHEAEAVRRTHKCVGGHVEYRAAVHLDEREIAAEALPGFSQSLIDGGQYDFHSG